MGTPGLVLIVTYELQGHAKRWNKDIKDSLIFDETRQRTELHVIQSFMSRWSHLPEDMFQGYGILVAAIRTTTRRVHVRR